MNISFVGHSHHRITRSSDFFLDILRQIGSVDQFWDETWRGEKTIDLSPIADRADLVVVWQSVKYALLLAGHGHRNVVYVPMYDAAKRLRRSFWRRLSHLKILNFSSTLHQRTQALGAPRSSYFQYFPDPAAHRPVSDFDSLRGFFWQRQERPTWHDVRRLIGAARFEAFHLHLAMDPGCQEPDPPSPEERAVWPVEVTRWLPERADLLKKLTSSNVYFAPRLDEGIGMAFLEAMAMGMAVCAHDSPTHNEYIVDGANGYLFHLDDPRQPDWSRAAEMGERARQSIETGFLRWRDDQPRLAEFLADPAPTSAVMRYARSAIPTGSDDPASNSGADRNVRIAATPHAREGGRRLSAGEATLDNPVLTVATVVRNAPKELAITLRSVTGQTYHDKEVILIDGGSNDETVGVIQQFSSRIDYWRSEPDRGPYDAMNKAAEFAHGRWIIFINAGDTFVDDDALSRLMHGGGDDVDFIAAHHAYLTPSGIEEIHRCTDLTRTYENLLAGETDGRWLGGIPSHQSLLTRVALIRTHRYDLSLGIAADHEFLFRMHQQGATSRIEPMILSQYVGGGLSWTHLMRCVEEWRAIALRYTRHPSQVERNFRRLRFDTMRYARRNAPFDWQSELARGHLPLALAAEAEYRIRSFLDRADGLYARARFG